MSPPSPPPTPDPYAVSRAQASANISVAVSNTLLGNADRIGPEGSSKFTIQRYYQVDDPQYNSSGTQVGVTTRQIPHMLETISLTPTAQTLFDQQQAVKQRMNELSLTQANKLNEIMGGPLSFDTLPNGGGPLRPPVLTRITPGSIAPANFISDVGPDDFSADKERTARTLFERLEYQADLTRTRLTRKLKDQGLRPGMQAYDEETFAFDKQTTDARTQALLAAGQEQSRLFGMALQKASFHNDAEQRKFENRIMIIDVPNKVALQQFQIFREAAVFAEQVRERARTEFLILRTNPMNEISALMHGGMVPVPQSQTFKGGHISDTPLAQSVYQSAALDMQKWQIQTDQQQKMAGGAMSMFGSIAGAAMMSDRRLKTDIQYLGTDGGGFRWHVWRYLWDSPVVRRVGVMAQEVLAVRPGAVVETPSRYLAVNYGMLG